MTKLGSDATSLMASLVLFISLIRGGGAETVATGGLSLATETCDDASSSAEMRTIVRKSAKPGNAQAQLGHAPRARARARRAGVHAAT